MNQAVMFERMPVKKMQTRMSAGWKGSDETVCGKGSSLANTAELRAYLPQLIKRYGIKLMCDAGAGDLAWIRTVELGCEYRAFDFIRRDPSVTELEISTQPLPPCDLILCRHVLNHLDPLRAQDALALFKQSGRYLLATTHDTKMFARYCNYSHWDLSVSPFNLGPPLERMRDATATEKDHFIALWKLNE